MKNEKSGPKILVFDIETSPIITYTWGLFDQTVGLNQIKQDWNIIAWAAKWYGDPASKVMYQDNRNAKSIHDDKRLVQGLADLVNEADIVITQNGDYFDVRKLSARAIINGLDPIKRCKSTDIYKEGKRIFGFTSHRLEYISNTLNKKYKKLRHNEYPGFELWKAVLDGEKRAWDVMKKYTIHDVLSTEEAYQKMQGWIRTQNLGAYYDEKLRCRCGSTDLYKKGFVYTDMGKYQGYKCKACGKRPKGSINLLSPEKRRHLTKE